MARKADAGKCEWHYERRRPERTLLYQLVTEHYPRFIEHLAAQDRTLPEYVQREFEDFLKCGRVEHGFLRVRCQDCHSERLVASSWSLLRIPAPATLVIPFTSQAAGLLPELRGPADGRKRSAAGGRGPAPSTDGRSCASLRSRH